MIRSIASALCAVVIALSVCIGASAEGNNGERHKNCTSITEAAKNYYANYTYGDMSELDPEVLLASLRTLMTETHTYESSYSDCRDKAEMTDSEGTSGKISLLYTSVTVTRAEFGGNSGQWNREHVWAKSLGGFDNTGAGADLHHVRPSDAKVNSIRDNLKYGNVKSGAEAKGSTLVGGAVGGTYSSPYFEPLDNVKGDVARICLYVYVRYGGELVKCNSITNVFESVEVLLEWCALDPVDEWEMSRNDVVENIQGNRNVFIDYPEYAWLIFGKEIPDNMITPSGEAMKPEVPDQQSCKHEFGELKKNENGETVRICRLCQKTELEEGDTNAVTTVIVVVGSVLGAAVIGFGAYLVFKTVRRKKEKSGE